MTYNNVKQQSLFVLYVGHSGLYSYFCVRTILIRGPSKLMVGNFEHRYFGALRLRSFSLVSVFSLIVFSLVEKLILYSNHTSINIYTVLKLVLFTFLLQSLPTSTNIISHISHLSTLIINDWSKWQNTICIWKVHLLHYQWVSQHKEMFYTIWSFCLFYNTAG